MKSIDPGPGFAVTVHLSKPDALLPEIIATAAGTIGESAYVEAKGKTYGTASGGVMCTGPFKLKSGVPGAGSRSSATRTTGTRHTSPRPAEIDFKFLTDPSTITNALLAGQIDGTFEAPIGAMKKLRQSSVGKFYLGKSTEWASVDPTEKKGPMHGSGIREAISLAISRGQIANDDLPRHGSSDPRRSAHPRSGRTHGRRSPRATPSFRRPR